MRAQDEARAALAARLWERRAEIEQAVITRIYAIADPGEINNPSYAAGLHETLAAALDFGLAGIGQDADRGPPIPAPLLAQARLAAQNGIGLDIVLRRYVAGFTLLSDFVLQEVVDGEPTLKVDALRPLLHSHTARLDRLLEGVGAEHRRACEERTTGSLDLRRFDRIRRLLDGELLDTSEFDYPFDAWHLGILATGPEALSLLRGLAKALDRIPLLVQPDSDTVWGWLGGRRPPGLDALHTSLPPDISPHRLAIGEAAEGLNGWRSTHRQAAAALPIANRGPDRVVRYADVALLASILQDDLLIDSLRQLYLEPLETGRDGGAVLRETLRAYIAADGSVSSTAITLKVSRRTVSKRLHRSEELLGRQLRSVLTDLDSALRLHRLMSRDSSIRSGS